MSADKAKEERYKLIFFAPPQDLPGLKTALFATGAGGYPNAGSGTGGSSYTEACFTTPGIGQFRPGEGARPHVGAPDQLEEVGEVRCEMICFGRDIVREAVGALKR